MTDLAAPLFSTAEHGQAGLRLRTLVRLRWLAVVGQTAAVLTVEFLLQYRLPLGFCFAAIALSAWLNIFLSLRWRHSVRLQPNHAAALLAYDVLQLAVLLFLTGGLQNPFAVLFLVPVTISATSLPLRWTASLGALALFCATFLAFRHLPLPWKTGESFAMPGPYVAGMWAAILCSVVFSAIYARRIAEEARQMSSALAATEMVLARAQRFSALDGLAAAAAHELGTPLATISLVAKELKREMPAAGPHAEDIDLLLSQSERCRLILARLANVRTETDEVYENTSFAAMLEDLVAPLRDGGIELAVELASLDGSAEPVFKRNPAIAYGLGNLLENALDFATRRVELTGRWSRGDITLTLRDDGPGFDPQIFDRLGDPFVTTRQGYGDDPSGREGHEGMGLGFFIAKTLLERSGATVSLLKPDPAKPGACVVIRWPRSRIDVAT